LKGEGESYKKKREGKRLDGLLVMWTFDYGGGSFWPGSLGKQLKPRRRREHVVRRKRRGEKLSEGEG